MHQLVGMGEMRRMGEIEEKLLPYLPHLPHLLRLPHLPHLHSRQKKQLLMTTPIQRGLGLWDDFIRIFLM